MFTARSTNQGRRNQSGRFRRSKTKSPSSSMSRLSTTSSSFPTPESSTSSHAAALCQQGTQQVPHLNPQIISNTTSISPQLKARVKKPQYIRMPQLVSQRRLQGSDADSEC